MNHEGVENQPSAKVSELTNEVSVLLARLDAIRPVRISQE